MNSIDILEEKEKKAIEYLKLVAKERTLIPLCDDIKILLNLVSTLIAENKELKDSNVELATTIDCLQTDLKEIKEEYSAEQKYEMENTIPKSKVEEEIDKLNKKEKDLQNSISDEEREEYSDANISFDLMDIDIRRETLQSILGKE